jgi:hypothetical protein
VRNISPTAVEAPLGPHTSFRQVGDLRGKADEARATLEALRVSLVRRQELLGAAARDKALRLEAKRSQLAENSAQACVRLRV